MSKVKRAQDAGAVGVIVVNNVTGQINMGGGDATITIPSLAISQSDGSKLKGKLPSPGVEATLTVWVFGGLVPSFSSRGPRYDGDALKPDIAAPGAAIISAYARSGTAAASFSGTSMAAPHAAGAMALLKQLHPTWSPQALKALLMNTGSDLWANLNQQPPLHSPVRVGGGLVNLPAAAAATAIAYDADTPDLVSLFYGAFEVAGSTSLTRTVKVENRGASEQTFTLGYAASSDIAGVDVSFPGGGSVTVPAGGNATFPVRLDAVASLMNHGVDGAADVTQGDKLRYLPAEEAGYVTLTPAGGTALRVPLYASARPVASVAVAENELILGAAQGTATLNLVGQGLDTGGSTATDVVSLVTPLELQYTGPASAPPVTANASIRYLGVGSDYAAEAGGSLAATTVLFGIATAADWKTPNEVGFTVRLDTNRDGTWDYSLAMVDAATLADPRRAAGRRLRCAAVPGNERVHVGRLPQPVLARAARHRGVRHQRRRAGRAGLVARARRRRHRVRLPRRVRQRGVRRRERHAEADLRRRQAGARPGRHRTGAGRSREPAPARVRPCGLRRQRLDRPAPPPPPQRVRQPRPGRAGVGERLHAVLLRRRRRLGARRRAGGLLGRGNGRRMQPHRRLRLGLRRRHGPRLRRGGRALLRQPGKLRLAHDRVGRRPHLHAGRDDHGDGGADRAPAAQAHAAEHSTEARGTAG